MRRRRYRTLAIALLASLGAALALASGARAQAGPSLRLAFPVADGTLTPYTFTQGYRLMTLVYDTLMWRDAEGIPQPWLARSVRREAGGMRVVAELRRGVRWHDGRPLTAADVAFTFDYVRSHEHPRFTPQLADLRSVTARGTGTVVFELRRRSLGFEDQPLADVPILPRHLWANLPAGRLAPPGLPVGSGPYRLIRYTPRGPEQRRGYTLRANRGYFLGAPTVAELALRIVPDATNALGEVDSGRLDAAPVASATAAFDDSAQVSFSEAPDFSGTMLRFNVARAPFDRLAARRAVVQAIDVAEIASARRGAGERTPATHGLLHPQSRWAGDEVEPLYDPEAARQAFSEQGVGTVRLLVAQDVIRQEAALRVQRALERVGARVQVAAVPTRELERTLGNADGARPTFEAAIVGLPALASYDPSFLRAEFGDPRTTPLNDGGYLSAPFERLADRVASATTEEQRRSAIADQQRLLLDELPALPLFFGGATIAYRPRAYDRWVDVLGSGILDKRSFLAAARAAQPERAAPPASIDPVDDESGFSLVPIIVVLAVVLCALVVWRLRRRRS